MRGGGEMMNERVGRGGSEQGVGVVNQG
jgi:hypothetical protein